MARPRDRMQARQMAAIEALLAVEAAGELATALAAERHAEVSASDALARRDGALARWQAYLKTGRLAPEIATLLAGDVTARERRLAACEAARKEAGLVLLRAEQAAALGRARSGAAERMAALSRRGWQKRVDERALAEAVAVAAGTRR